MMKRLTNYLFLMLLSGLVFIYSCDNNGDDPKPSAPSVTPPGSIAEVKVGEVIDITFNVTIPGGYKNSGVAVVGSGSAAVKTDMTADATSGSIVVAYTAGATAGADGVTLTVSDKSSQTTSNTAPIQVTEEAPPPANVVLAGLISEDSTLTADRIWELQGRVIIDEGATLTIEPGTIIKGREGALTNASALIISRGATIMAEGTAENPIIFTSILDNIKVGEKMGTNLDELENEKWGGLIVLGKAPISAGDGDTESSIEGLPADEPFAKYGGDVADDNSGTITYVSIRHGGISIGAGNEINGLTLGGVGSGTTIENIEIYATLDDGIEFFGGTVNVTNAMVAWQGDDGVDIDQNYAGIVDNFVVTHGAGVGTDEGLEVDGPEGSTYLDGLFTLKNGTIINDGAEGSAGDFKSLAQGTVENVTFSGYTTANIKIRASYSNNCMDGKADSFTHLTQDTPTLVFTGSDFDGSSVYTDSKADDGTTSCTVSQAEKDAAAAKMTPDDTATGADTSVFDWTAAKMSGLF